MKKTTNQRLPSSKAAAKPIKLTPDEIFDCVGVPVVVADDQLITITYANRKAVALFGLLDTVAALSEKAKTSKPGQFGQFLAGVLKNRKENSIAFTYKRKQWQASASPFQSGLVITIQQAAGEASLAGDLKWKSVFDAMGDLVMVTDADFNIIETNEPFSRAVGLSKKQLRRMRSPDLLDGFDEKLLREYQARAMKGPIVFDTVARNPDGSFSDFEINYFTIQAGAKKYFGSVSRDITEFKKVQSELERSNARFELIADATLEGLWELNLLTNHRWANDIHQSFYGLTKKDPVPPHAAWQSRIHPSVRNRVIASMEKAIARKSTKWVAEYWFNTHKGDYIYLYDRTLFVYDDDGKLIRMMGSMVDVTELKNAQEQLNIQKNLSEGIINSLPGVFYLLNRQGKFLRWNKNFEKITGYTAEEIEDMTAEKFFYHNEAPVVWKKMAEVFQKGKAEMEANLVNKIGEGRPFYLSGWRTVIGNEECLIGTGIDMSDMKKAQASIKRMELKITEQRIQEQKTISRAIINAQEKERNYIGRELHDNVNQLLAGARLYLTMGAKKDEEFAEMIKYPLELLDNGIQEIRYLTHRNITPSKDMDLKHLIFGIRDMLVAGNISCKVNYDVNISLNENLLINVYRILQEQANNVIKHSEAKNVSISIYDKGPNLFIETTDDGIGFNVHKLREGIGLYNIYSRVEAYNGDVEIESEDGKGCKIDIRIPSFGSQPIERYREEKTAQTQENMNPLMKARSRFENGN